MFDLSWCSPGLSERNQSVLTVTLIRQQPFQCDSVDKLKGFPRAAIDEFHRLALRRVDDAADTELDDRRSEVSSGPGDDEIVYRL